MSLVMIVGHDSHLYQLGALGAFVAGELIDESKKSLPDGREITFNKMNGGRTYPSLVVVARPNLKTRNISTSQSQKERGDLG